MGLLCWHCIVGHLHFIIQFYLGILHYLVIQRVLIELLCWTHLPNFDQQLHLGLVGILSLTTITFIQIKVPSPLTMNRCIFNVTVCIGTTGQLHKHVDLLVLERS